MSEKDLLDATQLNKLLKRAVRASMTETFGPLLEQERRRQDRTAEDLAALDDGDEDPKEVEEAEDDEEADKESKKDEPVKASKKSKEDAKEEIEVDVEEMEPQVLSPEEMEELEIEDVVDQLNKLRSGKSLKDESVRKQLSDYYDNLAAAEKKALFSYLQGLSQIMVGGVEGAEAPDPATYKIKTGGAEIQVKQKVKRVPAPGVKKRPGVAIAAGEETPIVVGESANKSRERHRLRELRRN